MNRSIFVVFRILFLFVGGISQLRANETQANSINQLQDFLSTVKKINLSYFSIFTGPAVSQGGLFTIERDGSPSDTGINNWTQLTVSLPINKTVSFEINLAFSNYYDKRENPFVMEDSTVGFGIRYYNSERLSINGGFNTILFPTSDDSIEDGLRLNPGGFQSLRYKLSPNLAVGSWLWFRFQSFDNNEGRRNFRSFAGPYINYTLTEKFSILTWVDFFFDHMPDRDLVEIERRDYTDYTIGASYTFSSALEFFPYIRTEIENGINEKKMAVGAWISGRLF
jgi:hypothetical protein